MEEHTLALGLISVRAPAAWDVGGEAGMPITLLNRDSECGALQFSAARFLSGAAPDPSVDVLLDMVDEVIGSNGLAHVRDRICEDSPLRLAAASCDDGECFFRIWYVSDGNHFAKITYTCEKGLEPAELADCERIVRTIRFT